jgi:hypothetical protein
MATSTELGFVLTGQGATLATGAIMTVNGTVNIEAAGALKLAGTQITSNASELNSLDGVPTTWPTLVPGTHGITIGSEVANVINVAVQLKDVTTTNPAVRKMLYCFLSDDAEGDGITATAADTIAIGTNGTIIEAHTSAKSFQVMTNATGAFDINITHAAGAKTYYLVICDGWNIQVTAAITFA